MNKIAILHISDIHFDRNEPENQGLVLNSFHIDLKNRISTNPENTFCIISGDLVKKGASDQVYNEFYDKFILKISEHVPIDHIFLTPGNHDFNRKYIEENLAYHNEILSNNLTESEFNEYIKNQSDYVPKKFEYFANFCLSKMHIPNFNLFGYSVLLVPEISIFFLNSALLSSGRFNDMIDTGKLKIETSELNKWIGENDGRKKIIVMHHPLSDLTNFAQMELTQIFKSSIYLVITGHKHDQNLEQGFITDKVGYIKCFSPQLFSDKADLNGYSILTFENNALKTLEYRQWVKRQRKFMSGQDFSGTENGICSFSENLLTLSNWTLEKLELELKKSMKSYSKTPEWIERTLTTTLPNANSKEKSEKLDYLHLINKPDNYQITAAPQFGLTCFARYLAVKAWKVKNELWLYFDCSECSLSKAVSNIHDSLEEYKVKNEEVKCLLLDNWKNQNKDSDKILDKFKKVFPEIPIILFTNCDDSIIIQGLDSEESHEGFKQLYLRELDRFGLRKIVKNFNNDHQIAEENRVLERLNLDLIDLNIHRTPINCIQLLLAFLNNFEDRPINRSKVFKYILKVIFDNPGNLYYGNTIDEDNCVFILGNFCEYLLKNNKESFIENEFYNISTQFAEKNYNTTNITDLLQILKNNQIIIGLNGHLKFRFSYWIFFFAAERMRKSTDFAEYMFKQRHTLYYPEIIEFYAGTDGAREDVVQLIIGDLNNLKESVHAKIGLKEDFNPFSYIKWALNETTKGMTQEQLEKNVRTSKLPDEIKEVVADKEYDSIRPYNQTIHNFFEEFDVRNLMNLTTSASRALRNSEFISPELKEELIQCIFNSWKEQIRVLLLIAPVLAKNGFGGLGGARFILDESFPKEYTDCLRKIVTMMPYNIMNWHKDDIFSDKLNLLFYKFLIDYDDPIVQHIIALLICSTRPIDWQKTIASYIGMIGKNSFYLGDLYESLRHNYSIKIMSQQELRQTEGLIKSCWAKHDTGTRMPGKTTISKVSDDILPSRTPDDFE